MTGIRSRSVNLLCGFWIFAALPALPLSRTGSQNQQQQIFLENPSNPKSLRSQLVQAIELIGPRLPRFYLIWFAHTCLFIQYLSASKDTPRSRFYLIRVHVRFAILRIWRALNLNSCAMLD